jgi:cyclophilin family peptidyl-prolyl cis-trans isomerase
MKNIVTIVIFILLLVGGAFYFMNKNKTDSSVGKTESYSTETATSTIVFEDGTLESSSGNSNLQNNSNQVSQNETKKNHMVTLDTNYGKIVIETYDGDAPKTVNNFVTLAQKGFYNGLTFHRVIKGFMIQGGDPIGNGTGGPGYQFEDELNPNTASYKAGYKKGVVAMANAGPNTNGSQFFIMHQDYPLPNNYTIFGHVVSGQEVVDKIANVQVGQNDKPVSPVIMKSVTVN